MLVVPLGQPGLPAGTDAPAEPSEEGGADFAALMAAMAATALNPPPVPPPVPATDGTPNAGDGASLPTGPAALPAAFGWAASGAAPMSAPTPATPATPPADPEALPAPAPTPVTASPVVESAAEAAAAPLAVPEPGSAPTERATPAETSPPSGETPVEAVAVPGRSQPSLDHAEAAADSGADEAPGSSKPVTTVGAAHDRFSTAATPAGGSLLATGAARAAEAPAHNTPVQHPPVVEQVVSVVEPLRHRGDGQHELTLDLRPAELGPIRVEVSIDRGTVHLSLHAEQAATGTLLDQALPELRAALEEAGLVAGRLGVGPGDREGGRPPAESRPAEGDEPEAARPAAATAVASVRPAVAPAAGALDLLL